jgi:hypothetical protein
VVSGSVSASSAMHNIPICKLRLSVVPNIWNGTQFQKL